MLDSLLGRAELKARIEELEEEKRHLERRLDAESERRADAVTARQDAEERVCVDDARLVSVALDPPLAPDPFVEWGATFRLDGDWFHPTDGLTVALVRSDRFAVGTYDGGALTEVETVETNVKSAHSKGGFSQSRFERRRDEQVATHIDDCSAVLDRRDPDRLVLLGERTVLDDVDRDAVAVEPVDASGDPAAALEDAAHTFFTTRLTLL